MYLIFVMYALFASVFIFAKVGLEYSQPLFFLGTRMIVAGILMLSYILLFAKDQFKFQAKDLLRITILASVAIYITNALELWGLQYLTAFNACFIYSLSPFLAAILSFFIFSERLSALKWVGLLIGFIGITPILLANKTMEDHAGHAISGYWPELALFGATLASAYGWIILKQLIQENKYSAVMANTWSMLIGGSLAIIHSAFVENWTPVPVTYFPPFLESTIALIIISNLICYNLYGHLLKKFSATFMSFAGFTTPIFTALLGWMFLGETVTWASLLSGIIVFLGLTLFYKEELSYASAIVD